MPERLAMLAIGYVCGSFLTADVVVRLREHKSVFEVGDGNPGMANVGHELGTKAALVVLAGDILKTVLAVVLARLLFGELGVRATAWAGLGTVLGHCFPFWHRLRGGKGVTCIASTIILMAPLWGAAAGVVGVAAIVVTGYLSVAAVVAMVFYCAAIFFAAPIECFYVSLVFLALTCYAHGSKLLGIRAGTTRKASLALKVRAKLKRS